MAEVKTGPSVKKKGYFAVVLCRVGDSKVHCLTVIFPRVRTLTVCVPTHYRRLLLLTQTSRQNRKEKKSVLQVKSLRCGLKFYVLVI